MAKERYTLSDLEMPDDEPMVIIRSSLLWICDGDKYAAAALNMYVHWTRWIMKHKPVAQEINRILKRQGKPASQDTSLVIYRKQSLLITDLLNFCNEKRLRQANDLLVAKGLLTIDGTARSISDRILKYELQIETFKTLMATWKKHRQESQAEEEDGVVESALEACSVETDNSPLRDGQFTASRRTIHRFETDNSPLVIRNIDDTLIDDTNRESTSVTFQNANDCDDLLSQDHHAPSLSPEEMIAYLSQQGYTISLPSKKEADTNSVESNDPQKEESSAKEEKVCTTPRRSVENGQSSIQHDESSTSCPATTVAKNATETNEKLLVSEKACNDVVVVGSGSPQENKPLKKATRKPRAKKEAFSIPDELRSRVERVYAKLDALRQKVTSDPEERYIRNEESDKAICTLFQGKPPTEEKLEKVYMSMWNEPRNPKSGWWTREHMTISTICKKYADQSMVYSAQESKAKGVATTFSVGGYTYRPEDEPVRQLAFVGASNIRGKRRGA